MTEEKYQSLIADIKKRNERKAKKEAELKLKERQRKEKERKRRLKEEKNYKKPLPYALQRYADMFMLTDTNEPLYETREELMEAELRGEGSINWDVWDYLIQRAKERRNVCR